MEIKPVPKPKSEKLPKSATVDALPSAHRLHPSHRRNTSDSLDKIVLGAVSRQTPPRDSRPPPSTRGFQYIPAPGPVQAPPASRAPAFYPPAGQASPLYYGGNTPKKADLPQQQEAASSQDVSGPPTPQDDEPATVSDVSVAEDYSLNDMPLPSPKLALDIPTVSEAPRDSAPPTRMSEKRRSQQLQQPELERIESGVEPSYFTHSHTRMSLQQRPPPLAHEDLVNVFPEPAAETVNTQASPAKKKKLTKTGGKLTKKNRWSLSKPSAIAA